MRVKKILAVVLMLAILVLSSAALVSARYQYINSASSSLAINVNGTATVMSSVIRTPSATSSTITATLQRQNANGTWSNVSGASWSNTTTSPLNSINQNHTVTSGTDYIDTSQKTFSIFIIALRYFVCNRGKGQY